MAVRALTPLVPRPTHALSYHEYRAQQESRKAKQRQERRIKELSTCK